MTAFPDIIGATLEFQPRFPTDNVERTELATQVVSLASAPRIHFRATFLELTPAQRKTITDHILEHVGGRDVFAWFFWDLFHWLWVPIGVGDGATTAFRIPGKETSEHEFFTGAGSATSGTISVGTGSDGTDVVTLSAAPAAGVAVWGNFRGRREFQVFYENDKQPTPRMVETSNFSFEMLIATAK